MRTDYEQLENRVSGLSMAVAPALLILSEVLRAISADAPRSQIYFLSQLLALASLAFFFPTVIGLTRLLGRWSPFTALSAAALALFGILGITSTITMRVIFWGLQRTLSDQVFVSVRRAVPIQVLVTVLAPGLFFSLGLATLAIGLYRSRVAPRWASILFIAGSILFPLASIPDVFLLILLANLAFFVSLSRIGAGIIASNVTAHGS